jgi:tetratricopeptide (TPR) repeat protein
MATASSDPFEQIEKLYDEILDPTKTKDILERLKALRESRRNDPRALAYDAIVLLCNYLNKWDGVDKRDLDGIGMETQIALLEHPDFAPAHYARGFFYRANGEHEAALESFTKATEIDSKYWRAYAQKGAELLYLGLPEMALLEVQKAIDHSPSSPTLGMYKWIFARVLFFKGDYKEAIPLLKQSIETWKALWYNRLYLVSAYALTGDEASAKRELDDFASKFPGYTIARVVKNEETNPNKIPFVVEGRRKFHLGLRIAGMPP